MRFSRGFPQKAAALSGFPFFFFITSEAMLALEGYDFSKAKKPLGEPASMGPCGACPRGSGVLELGAGQSSTPPPAKVLMHVWGHYFDGFWGLSKSEHGVVPFNLPLRG